ncbi:MAG: N-acetylmuramoyl-L-alanine amidase, partial [Actinobacteria bacterium]|nr:N-acetylmuramoyl-L-alanine amidase [Actinomycetota bacterium]
MTISKGMTISKKIIVSVFTILIILSFLMLTFFTPFGGKLFAAGSKIKVFLDAGHGGRDTGAIGFGFYEKTANLDIALRVKSKLEASGFTVVMSRSDDSNHSLDEIVNMANSSSADIFVSIHNNASISPYSHGTETYWSANGVAGSNQLASLIQSNVVSQTGRANRGVKTANFRVIKNTTMPGALVECAFISNQTENDLLKSEGFREKAAVGIFDAIKKFSEGIIKVDSSGGK